MHLATGNYNGSSAKIYTDISYFTRNAEFAKDTTAFSTSSAVTAKSGG